MLRRSLARIASCGCVGAAITLAALAHAEESAALADAPAASKPPEVELAIVGDTPSAGALGARIASWFHGQSIETRASAQKSLDSSTVFAPTAEPGVRVWAVIRGASSVRLFFAVEDRASQVPRYLVTDVALDSGLDELGMEQLAQVVYLSAMGLWAGNVESSRKEMEEGLRQAPLSAPPAPKPAPPAPRPVENRARASARVGLELGMRFVGDESLLTRGGLSFGAFQASRTNFLGAQLHAELPLPSEVDKSGVDLKFSGASLRLGLAAEHRIGGSWLVGELGPGLDFVRYRVVSLSDSSLRPTAGGFDVRPVSYLSFGARTQAGAFSIGFSFLIVFQLERTHYDVDTAGGPSEILVPHLVQPGFAAGLYW